MRFLYPAHPLSPREVDPDFEAEADLARALGADVSVLHLEPLLEDGDARRAVRFVEAADDERAVYRGWILPAHLYQRLYETLAEWKGLALVSDPDAYRAAQHLPQAYARLEGHTPETVWLRAEDATPERVVEAAAQLGDGPALLKDFVKSEKHAWEEACFIPSATDRAAVLRVADAFRARRGSALEGGLVFRRFVPLRRTGVHARSGMPVAVEVRCFFVAGALAARIRYWEGQMDDLPDVPEAMLALGGRIDSPFFTMDFAQREDGTWTVIETGDGQVSGFQDSAEGMRAVYTALVAMR
ncbi:ATP-grasp domain-containing protein [Longimicrobium sp.]|uniref:ATP-grasp domain-containing protein n=1 Tax=Longimicrobium sp. TaxID=2029185 RepID=UPI002E30229B|nr:ATP-grasp domain-containing protein [Longimicrobium sp.]HEX6039468.1 ATP-grasp domain-containing protein [Longimicrobium sp.]